MDEQRQDDQLEPIYNNSVVKTSRERWTIEKGGEWGSGRSVPAARHDDDDDDVYFYSYHNIKINCGKIIGFTLELFGFTPPKF